jgi:hypothetical protein
MELVFAFLLVAASPNAPAQTGAVSAAVRLMDDVPGDHMLGAQDPRPRVIVSSDFPPLDVIPGERAMGRQRNEATPMMCSRWSAFSCTRMNSTWKG